MGKVGLSWLKWVENGCSGILLLIRRVEVGCSWSKVGGSG